MSLLALVLSEYIHARDTPRFPWSNLVIVFVNTPTARISHILSTLPLRSSTLSSPRVLRCDSRVKTRSVQVRLKSCLSHICESFVNYNCTDLVDLLSIYSAVDQIGVHRVGIADTVGVSSSTTYGIYPIPLLMGNSALLPAKFMSLSVCSEVSSTVISKLISTTILVVLLQMLSALWKPVPLISTLQFSVSVNVMVSPLLAV